jgi:hypothetical protein
LFGLFPFFRSRAGSRGTKPASVRRRPSLEVLEDRTVPAVVDLTTLGAQGAIGAALFQQNINDKGGNGNLAPFVRLSSNPKTEMAQGYNTDARPVQFDEYQSQTYTHSLPLSQVPTVSVSGITYSELVVNIDQSSSSPLLSLDEFRVYVGNAPNLLGYNPSSNQLAGLTAVYDMDASGANTVILNASLKPGRGLGDARVLVPTNLLASPGNSYFYLYSKFGATIPAQGGYEAWDIRIGSGTVTSSASLSGLVSLDNGYGIVSPLGGVTLTLTGTTSTGQQVTLSVMSNPDGSYSFGNLQAGTYTITETVPLGDTAESASAGTVNGTTDGTVASSYTQIFGITLGATDTGINYNFTNYLIPAS